MLATQDPRQDPDFRPEDAPAAHPERDPAPQTASRRDLTFDILKGIGILEVMIHHLLAYSARKFAVPDAPEWWAMVLTNRVLHFAVPTFLLASALLLARSLASRSAPDWKRFYLRRGERTLWPYLVWSLLYLGFRLYVLKIGSDVISRTTPLPWGASLTGPAVLVDPSQWIRNLVWGKAYYHLYFMSVLLQFSLAFPVLFYGLRRCRLTFGRLLLLSAFLQIGVFYLHASVFAPRWGFTTPGSLALWYLPALLIGTWIGLNWKSWPEVWREWRPHLVLGTLFGFLLYFALSIRQLQGQPISSFGFNAGATLYATGMAALLLVVSNRLAGHLRVGPLLARIGDRSLPLFLIHPMVLHFFGGPRISAFLDALPLTPIWAGLLLLGLTWTLIEALVRMRLDRFLFGRRFSSN
ncbi:MAG: acyltransferase [Armatimonadetes bacterium]|nr:acyltransferase [Armatimonadota bacterium]